MTHSLSVWGLYLAEMPQVSLRSRRRHACSEPDRAPQGRTHRVGWKNQVNAAIAKACRQRLSQDFLSDPRLCGVRATCNPSNTSDWSAEAANWFVYVHMTSVAPDFEVSEPGAAMAQGSEEWPKQQANRLGDMTHLRLMRRRSEFGALGDAA